jgi:hypothetical protein
MELKSPRRFHAVESRKKKFKGKNQRGGRIQINIMMSGMCIQME